MIDLNSGDEKVWMPAYEQLEYFNPQLELTLPEQLALVTSDNGKRLLFGLWTGVLFTFDEGTAYQTELKFDPKDQTQRNVLVTFAVTRNGRKSSPGMGGTVEPLESLNSSAWNRAEVAARVLRRIDTKDSRSVLEHLATGHKSTKPTRVAAQLLEMKPDTLAKGAFADTWLKLNHVSTTEVFDGMFALTHTPGAAKLLKEKLPAIKASKDEMTAWMKALDDEDAKVWRPAFEKLLYFRPRIALDWQEQIDAVTTAHGRTALFGLWRGYAATPPNLDPDPDCALEIEERNEGQKRLKLSTPSPNGKRDSIAVELKAMDEMHSHHWRRARLAVTVLERMKTDEARAVLKQLADGHPDILPTKDAKAALERMK